MDSPPNETPEHSEAAKKKAFYGARDKVVAYMQTILKHE